MTEEGIVRLIGGITDAILDRNRDYKFIVTDYDNKVLGGLNKTNSNTIEIHSFMPEEESVQECEEENRTPCKDFETCDDCVYAEYEPMQFPCRKCIHNAQEYFKRRLDNGD